MKILSYEAAAPYALLTASFSIKFLHSSKEFDLGKVCPQKRRMVPDVLWKCEERWIHCDGNYLVCAKIVLQLHENGEKAKHNMRKKNQLYNEIKTCYF